MYCTTTLLPSSGDNVMQTADSFHQTERGQIPESYNPNSPIHRTEAVKNASANCNIVCIAVWTADLCNKSFN